MLFNTICCMYKGPLFRICAQLWPIKRKWTTLSISFPVSFSGGSLLHQILPSPGKTYPIQLISNRTRDVKLVEESSGAFFITRMVVKVSHHLVLNLNKKSITLTRTGKKNLPDLQLCGCYRRTWMGLLIIRLLAMLYMLSTQISAKEGQGIRIGLIVEFGLLFGIQVAHMQVMSLYHHILPKPLQKWIL